MESFVADLIEWLRIPSISAQPEYASAVRQAAMYTGNLFARAGLEKVHLIEGDGFPLVYAEWMHAPGAPTLLCYGHYDVQPPDPLDQWRTHPFEPAVIGDNLYARGAADDKGLAIIPIEAAARFLRSGAPLPVNLRFLYEGEEESGGEHLAKFLRGAGEPLRADAAVICDTEMFAPELPTICVGLRGILYAELTVRTAAADLHSGVYGGAVPNAIFASAEILTRLKGAQGVVDVPGFYDGIEPPTAAELEAWLSLPFVEEEFRAKEARVLALTGEPGFTVLERSWARPTLEVHGIRGGFTGDGAKTVIPCEAVTKLSCRLVPGQNPEHVAQCLAAAIAAATPPGATAEFRVLHAASACVVDPANRYVHEAAEAMSEVFGNRTVYTRSGGSIPVVGLFQEVFAMPSVMMGFGLPDDNLHAPNEKVYLPNVSRGITAMARYWERLGGHA